MRVSVGREEIEKKDKTSKTRVRFYLDVESLMMTTLAATIGDIILRQLHADQILHDQLGVVVVVVMMVIIIVVDVVVIVLVDQPAVSD